jgi:hypothetical protein
VAIRMRLTSARLYEKKALGTLGVTNV